MPPLGRTCPIPEQGSLIDVASLQSSAQDRLIHRYVLQAIVENPAPGEVIWRDDVGVTCRRRNWRQGTRPRLDGTTGRMWFILESFGSMPETAVGDAGNAFMESLVPLMPGYKVTKQNVSFNEG